MDVQNRAETVEIHMPDGRVAIVDAGLRWMRFYRWHYSGPYPCRTVNVDGKRHHVYMHHHVLPNLGKRSGVDVDHIDGDPLNNRRANLEHVPHGLNVARGFARKRRIREEGGGA